MKTRTLTILAAVALGAGTLAYVAVRSRAPDAGKSEQKALIPDFPADQVTKIAVKKAAADITVERGGDAKTWTLPSKGGFPADFERVKTLMTGLIDSKIVEPKTSLPDMYPRLGVEDPKPDNSSTQLTLSDKDGKALATLILGSRDFSASGTSPRTFARRVGDTQAYLVEGDLRAETDPLLWMSRTIVELTGQRVKSVTITQPGGEKVAIEMTGGTYRVTNVPEGRTLKDEFVGSRIGSVLASIMLDDVKPAKDVDLATDTPTAEFRTSDGLVVTVKARKIETKFWATFAAAYDPPPAPAPPEIKPDATPEEKQAAEARKADDAKQRELAESTVKSEVETLNKRWAPWAFAIPDFKAEQLTSKMDSLLAAPAAEQPVQPLPTQPQPTPQPDSDTPSLVPPPK